MKRIVLFASFIFFNIDTGRAASFDCDKATTDNEIMICMDQWLSKLDEDYARLYGITRDAFTVTVNTKQRFLQNQARVALREREKKCKDRACLVNWYERGRTRLHGHLWHEAPNTLVTEVTPQLLYSKLNLRSFASMDGPVVKHYCESYLDKYYPESAVSFTDNSLTIDNGEKYWKIEIVDDMRLLVWNKIYGSSYDKVSNVKVFFDPGSNDLRALSRPKDGMVFNISQASDCKLFGKAENQVNSANNAANSVTTTNLASVDVLDSQSVGEISLSHYKFSSASVPVFISPDGPRLGLLNLSAKDDGIEGSIAKAEIVFDDLNAHIEPQILYRAKVHPVLLAFTDRGEWINLSPHSSKPAWLNLGMLPNSLSDRYDRRDKIVVEATRVTVKSAHRLRSAPSTNSDTLLIMKPRQDVALIPLQIEGDWLEAMHVSPSPIHEYIEEIMVDPKFTVTQGWLKWRKSPNHQYVDVEYRLGF